MASLTTGSSTLGCASSRRSGLASWFVVLAWVCAVGLWGQDGWAQTIEAQTAKVVLEDDAWVVDADFDFVLTSTLADAVTRGVPLYFVTDFEVRRQRWYWFDEKLFGAQHVARLSYNALTNQYRVLIGAGPLAQRHDDLASALRAIARVRHWRIADAGQFRAGEKYHAHVRMRLDLAQLPKPFQLNAITNREWALTSEWLETSFAP